jgi:hypothetical protein
LVPSASYARLNLRASDFGLGLFGVPGEAQLKNSDDTRVPGWFAIKRLGVTKQTFNYWRTSGKITPDDNGEYRWGDVIQVELDMRNSPNSRRGITLRPSTRPNWAALDTNSTGIQLSA